MTMTELSLGFSVDVAGIDDMSYQALRLGARLSFSLFMRGCIAMVLDS
jgi:hypothetical protein